MRNEELLDLAWLGLAWLGLAWLGLAWFDLTWFCVDRIQAGKHYEALELLKTAMKIEEKELGARPHRMVELYALMAEIYDEVRRSINLPLLL